MEAFNLNEDLCIEQVETRDFERWKKYALEEARQGKKLLEIKSIQVYQPPQTYAYLCIIYQTRPFAAHEPLMPG